MSSGIYSITHESGKRYIGSAVSFSRRWRMHRHLLRQGTHHPIHLQRAFDKHGDGAFVFEVLEECDIALLIEREQWWIDAAQPEYNICRTAGSSRGCHHAPETRAKMSAVRKGMKKGPRSAEHRLHLSEANRGHKTSAEARAKLSVAGKGRRHTAEAKAKVSAAKMGHSVSPETRAKLAEANIGKKQSAETRAKRSAAMMGNKSNLGHKNHLGHKHTPEAKAKMSATKRARAKLRLEETSGI